MERAYNFLDFLRALSYDAIESETGRLSSLVNFPSDVLYSYLSFLNEGALMRLFKRAIDENQDKLIFSSANAVVKYHLMHIPRRLDALRDFLDAFYPQDSLSQSLERLQQAFRFKDSWLTEERVFYGVLREILNTETSFRPALRAVQRHFDREKTTRVHQVNVVLTFTELSNRLIESYFSSRPFIRRHDDERDRIKNVFHNHLQKGIIRGVMNTRMRTSGTAIFAENEVFSPEFVDSARRAQELLNSSTELVGEQTYYVRYTFADGMGEYFDLSPEGHSAGLAFAYLKFAGAMEIDHRYLHYVNFWGSLSPEGVVVKNIGRESALRKYEVAKANGIRVIVLEENDFRELCDGVDLRNIRFIEYAEDNVVEVVRAVHERLQEHLQPSTAQRPTIRDCVKVTVEHAASLFYMTRYPITNSQYKSFLNDTAHLSVDSSGAKFPYPYSTNELDKEYNWRDDGTYPPGKDNYPVVLVTWDDAKAYAEWVGGRLPTKEEWELAAKGVPPRRYPWGEQFSTYFCNTLESRIGETTPVDRYPQGVSPYGCFDMIGNVWEWVADEPEQDRRILHGGSFYNSVSMHVWPYENEIWPRLFKARDIGFRILFDRLESVYQRPEPPSKHRELKDGTILVSIEGQEFFFGPERERRKVDTFAISIYPVQNWQYYNFLRENYGLVNRPSTSDEALHHLWPSAWGDSYPEGKANHPVTGIEPPAIRQYLSWVYEGVATLPTEDEWLLAAYGPHGWLYPWGDYFDVSKCNVYESGHGNTTPVDFYKDGVSYFGCYDMAGNCFEFIESKLNPIEHVVRGGSYLLDHTYASCLARKENAPLNRGFDLGFRIVTHGMIF